VYREGVFDAAQYEKYWQIIKKSGGMRARRMFLQRICKKAEDTPGEYRGDYMAREAAKGGNPVTNRYKVSR